MASLFLLAAMAIAAAASMKVRNVIPELRVCNGFLNEVLLVAALLLPKAAITELGECLKPGSPCLCVRRDERLEVECMLNLSVIARALC